MTLKVSTESDSCGGGRGPRPVGGRRLGESALPLPWASTWVGGRTGADDSGQALGGADADGGSSARRAQGSVPHGSVRAEVGGERTARRGGRQASLRAGPAADSRRSSAGGGGGNWLHARRSRHTHTLHTLRTLPLPPRGMREGGDTIRLYVRIEDLLYTPQAACKKTVPSEGPCSPSSPWQPARRR